MVHLKQINRNEDLGEKNMSASDDVHEKRACAWFIANLKYHGNGACFECSFWHIQCQKVNTGMNIHVYHLWF